MAGKKYYIDESMSFADQIDNDFDNADPVNIYISACTEHETLCSPVVSQMIKSHEPALILRHRYLGVAGAHALATVVPFCPWLRVLDLTGTGIGAEGAGVVVEACLAHGDIQAISLACNELLVESYELSSTFEPAKLTPEQLDMMVLSPEDAARAIEAQRAAERIAHMQRSSELPRLLGQLAASAGGMLSLDLSDTGVDDQWLAAVGEGLGMIEGLNVAQNNISDDFLAILAGVISGTPASTLCKSRPSLASVALQLAAQPVLTGEKPSSRNLELSYTRISISTLLITLLSSLGPSLSALGVAGLAGKPDDIVQLMKTISTSNKELQSFSAARITPLDQMAASSITEVARSLASIISNGTSEVAFSMHGANFSHSDIDIIAQAILSAQSLLSLTISSSSGSDAQVLRKSAKTGTKIIITR